MGQTYGGSNEADEFCLLVIHGKVHRFDRPGPPVGEFDGVDHLDQLTAQIDVSGPGADTQVTVDGIHGPRAGHQGGGHQQERTNLHAEIPPSENADKRNEIGVKSTVCLPVCLSVGLSRTGSLMLTIQKCTATKEGHVREETDQR